MYAQRHVAKEKTDLFGISIKPSFMSVCQIFMSVTVAETHSGHFLNSSCLCVLYRSAVIENVVFVCKFCLRKIYICRAKYSMPTFVGAGTHTDIVNLFHSG